jgi:hypothetical protein
MNQHAPSEAWSDLDDVILAAWMRIYENPLAHPLTFEIINGVGDAAVVSSLELNDGAQRRAWWEGWAYMPPITIRVRDVHGKGFDFQLPIPDRSERQTP